MRKIIKTEELPINNIPDGDADWHEISIFALTFDPMLELGIIDIYKPQFIEYDEGSSVQELRRSLFLWQRAWNTQLGKIDEKGLQMFRNLLALMRKN